MYKIEIKDFNYNRIKFIKMKERISITTQENYKNERKNFVYNRRKFIEMKERISLITEENL